MRLTFLITLLFCAGLQAQDPFDPFWNVRVAAAPSGPQEWITSYAGGSTSAGMDGLRVGHRFTANSAITITHLGVWVTSGNTGNRTLYLFDTTVANPCNTANAIAAVVVDTTGQPAGAFLYGSVTPVVLVNGRDYIIQTTVLTAQNITAGGTPTATGVATAGANSFSDASACQTSAAGNLGPINFKYTP